MIGLFEMKWSLTGDQASDRRRVVKLETYTGRFSVSPLLAIYLFHLDSKGELITVKLTNSRSLCPRRRRLLIVSFCIECKVSIPKPE